MGWFPFYRIRTISWIHQKFLQFKLCSQFNIFLEFLKSFISSYYLLIIIIRLCLLFVVAHLTVPIYLVSHQQVYVVPQSTCQRLMVRTARLHTNAATLIYATHTASRKLVLILLKLAVICGSLSCSFFCCINSTICCKRCFQL
jgi:hypothetical protein